ncbi:MAG: adenylosuccinate lyase [Clostridia bacterium]|nr:adenylosuccinate lyase [Clostridia bacterium]
MNNTEIYNSPLASRYASDYMLRLFSQDERIKTWRKLWVSLAKAEMKLGLPITEAQVDELAAHIDDIDYDTAAKREKEVRHDVMAHVYTYGLAAPSAAGIIHLGATSCYVTDNADLVIYRDGLNYLKGELKSVIKNLAAFAEKYKALPTLGYTHYQPAQLVTVGKRAALWIQDLVSDLNELDFAVKNLRFLGCRGTTGTEASFMELFEGDTAKIDEMNRMIAADFGFDEIFGVSGQTYPRKVDSRILNALSSVAQSLYRMANDIRLLQHDRQIEEPFEKNQIGSSAMAYKRNPMRCERICSLSRYLMSDAMNAPMTASVQWLERTLDDSANRRISMPEGFLCADAILRLAKNVTDGLHVNERIVERTVMEYLPFIATENLMMEGVKRGGDRQKLHEIIRTCSMKATKRMKEGLECDLLDRLKNEPEFGLTGDEFDELLKPEKYVGRCPEQVTAYLKTVLPLLEGADDSEAEINL